MKRISVILLLAIVGIATVASWRLYSVAELQTSEDANMSTINEFPETVPKDTVKTVPEVIAYYFHTTYRCVSCKKIEAYSKEAIESGFAKELKKGTLEFKSINVEELGNKHFIRDYGLYAKSLIICDLENGKQTQWKNLTKVWQLIRNKDEFVKYVQDEINAYLKES